MNKASNKGKYGQRKAAEMLKADGYKVEGWLRGQ